MLAPCLAVVLAAAPAETGKTSVTVVVDGAATSARERLTQLELPVALRLAEVPQVSPPPSSAAWAARLANARKAWVQAAFDACLRELDDEAALNELLAAQERELAARLITWRTACLSGAMQPQRAQAVAATLGVLGLSLPPDAASLTPDVEALLARAITSTPAATLSVSVTSVPAGASVAVDGRPGACTAPCTVNLVPGAHVVHLSADGYTPAWRVTTGELPEVTLEPASPEVAAAQWRRRIERGDAIDGELPVRLLSTALRTPRLAVFTADPAAPKTLRGALAVDGVLVTRATREDDVEGLVRDLLVRGKVVEEAPPLYRRWPFWVAVGAAAVAAGVTTAVVVGTRQTVSSVDFSP